LTEERRPGIGTNPVELWMRWYEASMSAWSGSLRGIPGGSQAGYAAPYSLYQRWFETMEDLRDSMMGGTGTLALTAPAGFPVGVVDGLDGAAAQETWRKVFDASVESWQKSAGLGQEMLAMAPRWFEMLDQARSNFASAKSFPKDPLEFSVQWYNATSGPFSEFINDLIEREEFLEFGSRWLRSYASLYKISSRQSEEYLKALQLPVRSDITRVAGLVVSLEDKVDRIEEAFEDLEDAREATPATTAAGEPGELEERLDRVEGKLDRLLAAMETESTNGGGAAVSEGSDPEETEVRATAAARRKARELDVDLRGIGGTGANGLITVEDVRTKGDS
jgi:polyhydroxyalkanoic acid synthase PhaR subunit